MSSIVFNRLFIIFAEVTIVKTFHASGETYLCTKRHTHTHTRTRSNGLFRAKERLNRVRDIAHVPIKRNYQTLVFAVHSAEPREREREREGGTVGNPSKLPRYSLPIPWRIEIKLIRGPRYQDLNKSTAQVTDRSQQVGHVL